MKTTTSFLLALLFLFLYTIKLKAGDIDSLTAKKVAENFYWEKAPVSKSVLSKGITLSRVMSERKDGATVYYIYNISGDNGFIIISGDDRTKPVIGYSFEDNIDLTENAPPGFLDWMDARAEEIKGLKSSLRATSFSRDEQWDKYLKMDNSSKLKTASKSTSLITLSNVSPLLSSNWNQGCGYNADCPSDVSGPCGHVWAGCVATAMAQVMKYHNYPATGSGSNSWTSPTYGLISADFGATTYDWAGMPVPNGAYDADVEKLMFHCGVSVNMNYRPTGSGSYVSTATNSLIKYFGYSSNALYTNKSGYADTSWAKLMIKECDAGRPVLYKGIGSGGHAFVLDGYQGTDYFHINWGWGGSYNGYFYLDDLTPGSSNFTNSQEATVGIEPLGSFPGLNCSTAVPLNCGTPYSGSTFGATNIVNRYGNCYYDATGPEVIHTFTTTMPGRISVSFSSGANFGVYLLSDCNKDSLLAYSNGTLIYDNSLPGTYYLVIDGTYGSEGDYSVTVNCPTPDADLIFLSSMVSPNYVESFQPNVQFDCEIKNIGNSIAGENEIKYYFSTDKILDGSDLLIDSIKLLSTSPGESRLVQKTVTMPGGLTPGSFYIIFQVDADSVVVESDEDLNTSYGYVQVPKAGTMDCSSALPLASGTKYYGNTNANGSANIENYSCVSALADKEVIHKMTAMYSGLANIEFSERVTGEIYLIILPSCNENTCTWGRAIWGMKDTLLTEKIPVIGNTEYYFITDAKEGVNGDYSLLVTMPDSCPSVEIGHWGDLDRCIGSGSPSLYTDWGQGKYQWYRNEAKIDGATTESYSPSEDGEYWVEVTENGCSVASGHLVVTYSPEPDTAHITSYGDTIFCYGNSVDLNLYTHSGYTINWAKNDEPIPGAISTTFTATESGVYTAQVTNISCTVSSNDIEVIAHPLASEPGNPLPVPDTGLITYLEFNGTNTDLSGNNNWNWPVNDVTLKDNRLGEPYEAYYFNGVDEYAYTSKLYSQPDKFTLSFWFKTATTKGGRLAGFGDVYKNKSTKSDRQVYMGDDGRIHFGVDNGTPNTISSTSTYNDNIWHHVAVCLSPAGTKLYIDGALIDSDPSVTYGGTYNGYWKFAYDTILPGYGNLPTNNHFEGLLDEVKIYNWELLPGEIQTLFEEQIVMVSLENDQTCDGPDSTNVAITNSQPGVEYQLRNDGDNSLIGVPAQGIGETIYLPTGTISSTTVFNILATQTATGCEDELDTLLVFSIYNLPAISLGPDITACDDTILKDLSGNNYPGYSWSTGESTSQVTVLSDGTYSLMVTDSYGCTNSDTIQVAIHETPSVTVNTTPTDCKTANGSATVIATGGTGTYSYLWDSTIVDYTGTTASSLYAGSHHVTVDDGNCPLVKTFSITATGVPNMNITISKDSICQDDSSHILLSGADSYSWSPTGETTTIGPGEFYAGPDTTTIYYISGTTDGCSDMDTTIIFVKKNPEVNLGRDTVICGTDYLLNANTGFDSYLWSNGSTDQSILIDTSAAGNGTTMYKVTVSSHGCNASDSVKVTFDGCSSLMNYNEDTWRYYPNPTFGHVTLEFSEELNSTIKIIITDIGGNIIKDLEIQDPSGYKKEIDLTNCNEGVLLIRIITGNKVFSSKLLKL
jgi:hypothetical protein